MTNPDKLRTYATTLAAYSEHAQARDLRQIADSYQELDTALKSQIEISNELRRNLNEREECAKKLDEALRDLLMVEGHECETTSDYELRRKAIGNAKAALANAGDRKQ